MVCTQRILTHVGLVWDFQATPGDTDTEAEAEPEQRLKAPVDQVKCWRLCFVHCSYVLVPPGTDFHVEAAIE